MTVCSRASSEMTSCQVRELSPMPWISSSGGPWPAIRYARR